MTFRSWLLSSSLEQQQLNANRIVRDRIVREIMLLKCLHENRKLLKLLNQLYNFEYFNTLKTA